MNILYFASLKESLNKTNEKIILAPNTTVAMLKKQLIEKYDTQRFPNNILCALNQQIAKDSTIIQPCDEVAFYPPVTGG